LINFTRRVYRSTQEGFEKRLASYGAMAVAAALGGAAPLEAGIIHHDPADVTTPLNGFLAFNMSSGAVSTTNSGGMNFRLLWNTFSCSCTSTTSSGFPLLYTARYAGAFGIAGNNRILTSSSFYPLRLSNSSNIGAGSSFGFGGTLAAAGNFFPSYGSWLPGPGGASGFLGIQFELSGNTHHGWANITVNPDFSTTLHSFAYEACPDEDIHIGSTSGGATCDAGAVPEPHSAALMALGAAGIVALRRRRKIAS
jgi:hypothetical protein